MVASYLIITMPASSAASVRLYDSVSGIEYGSPISLGPWDMVSREVSVEQGTGNLGFTLSNGSSSVNVEGAWLYRCRDRNPYECMESILVGVDAFPGNVDVGYEWSDISGGDPQRANLLCFVKLNHAGKVVWTAFWTVVERDGQSFTVRESDISDVRVYGNMEMLPAIREFITGYQMIPANPAWISRVVFQGASSLYEIGMDTAGDISSQPNSASYQEIAGNEMGSVSRNHSFVFPVAAGVDNPVTLVLNPSYTCGMFGCERDKGESSSSCCLDCPCSSGYYCDASMGCRQISGIALSLYGTVNPRVLNCYESHVVSIPVHIDNAPSGHSIAESWYKLGGKFSACACTRGSGDIYVCPVAVPPVEECGSGEFRISDNAIRFRVDYMDGSRPESRYVEAPFPDVTIGSFVCGENGCEEELGESTETCCYDCGCPGGYCDYEWGADPGTGKCMNDLAAGDVHVEGVEPAHFYTHTPGDSVLFSIVIDNRPKMFSLEQLSCEMGCSYGNGEECNSSCSVEWSEVQSSDPDKYNLSCMVTFTVSDYDPLRDYVLSPVMVFGVRYRNGTGEYIEREISKIFSQVSIGAHWCGDRVCGEDEGYATCCYDCGCPAGQYCDTQSLEGPTEGDGCRSAGFGIVIDSIGSLELEDSSVEHDVLVFMHIANYPSGTEVVPKCMLSGGDVSCEVSCVPVSSDNPGDYNLSCAMTVPALDYVTSLHYDPGTRKITLSGNSINVSIYYNDGHDKGAVSLEQGIGDAVINVTSHCGEGSGDPFIMCESWLGEDQTSCCRDCGCSDFGESYFCYVGAGPNGECVDNSTIDLRILGFEPDPWECIIGRFGGDCIYARKHVVNAHIINSPDDIDILNVFYNVDGKEFTDINCIETVTYGNRDCAFIPDSLKVDWSGSGVEERVNRTFELFMSASYTLNGVSLVKNVSALNERIGTNKVKSDALIKCEEEIERINETINRLLANQGGYDDYGWMYYVMGVMYIGVGIALLCSHEPTTTTKILGYFLIAMGTLMVALGTMSQDEGDDINIQIEEIRKTMEQKKKLCSSESFEKTALVTHGVSALTPVVY